MKDTNTLRILQYNIRHETGTMMTLLEDRAVQEMDVLAIQEPCCNPHTKSSYNPGSSCFYLAHRTGADTRTCFYINKKLNPESWEIEHISRNTSTLTIQVEAREEENSRTRRLHIHNVYNPSPSSVSADNPSSLSDIPRLIQHEGEHILLGDFNLHYPNWNNSGRFTYHREADDLIATTALRDMELILPSKAVTWRSRGSESTIDLIFATPEIVETVIQCRVRPKTQHGSDHLPIYTEFDLGIEQPPEVRRRAWKTADPEGIRRGAQALNSVLPLSPLTHSEQVDEYVDKLYQGLREIVERAVPWAKSIGKGKSFWSRECSQVSREAKSLASQYQTSRSRYSENAWKAAIKRRNKVLSKAKALHFREGVHRAAQSSKGIWNLAKWARNESMNPRPLPKFPPLKKHNEGPATTFEEKVETLRETFFPPPPQADLADIPGTIYPPPLTMDEVITEEEIRRAIFRPKPDKAPGVDGMPNRFLRLIAGELITKFRHLFQACVKLGYHPREFKKANTIVLRKPKKDDYSEPKSYRPIALLSTLGKALETVVAKRLSDCAENNNLLPPEQMGARRKRSTETALETIVDAVHTV